MSVLQIGVVEAVAFAAAVLLLGYVLNHLVRPLGELNLPAAVVGGLVAAVAILIVQRTGLAQVRIDLTLQAPLMNLFFASIGYGGSWALLRSSGRAVLMFLALCSGVILVQNSAGLLVAWATGQHPLFGVLTGSVALAGGPGTALAFGQSFEAAGVVNAAEAGLIAAVCGAVLGGVLSPPAARWLIRRHGLRGSAATTDAHTRTAAPESPTGSLGGDATRHSVALILIVWLGAYVSQGIAALGFTLPGYIGALVVGVLLRNLMDNLAPRTLEPGWMDAIGSMCLGLFLALTIASLDLMRVAGAALPLLANLLVQTLLVMGVALTVVFRFGGRNYEGAVLAGGFVGLMLGTTANALATMNALTERYGPAPRAFIIIPLVGACFIDLVNASLITGFLSALR